MYVQESKTTINGKTYSSFTLRQSYRENGKVRKKTLCCISHLPLEKIKAIKLALSGELISPQTDNDLSKMTYQTGKTVGSCMVVNKLLNELGISAALGKSNMADLVKWLIFARLNEQGSRLSNVRLADRHDASVFGLKKFNEDNLYSALEWLADRQEDIQQNLLRTKYKGNKPELFLYDVTSSYFEGVKNELANFGYNRDKKAGKKQIVIGMLTDKDGHPIACEVFKGNTSDITTFATLVKDFGKRFGVEKVTMVGDKGMIKTFGINELHKEGFTYITSITKAQIKTLLQNDIIQLGLFDEDLHEVSMDSVRYVLRKNPVRAGQISANRNSKIDKLLKLAEKESKYLNAHLKASSVKALNRVLAYANKLRISNLVELKIGNTGIEAILNEDNIKEAAMLDGCYVLRTDILAEDLDLNKIHERYKDLAKVEMGFRTIKTGLLEVRPIWLRKEKRTIGHIFVCMLAYMVSRKLAENKMPGETITDIIAELNRVHLLHIVTQDESVEKLTIIAQPPARAAQILANLNIKLQPRKRVTH